MRVYLLNPSIALPEHYYRNGRLELDVAESPALTRQTQTLEVEKGLRVSGFAQLTLLDTAINRVVFGTGLNSLSRKQDAVIEISGVNMPVMLSVVRIDKGYVCEASLIENSWPALLRDLNMQDIDLGESQLIDKEYLNNNMILTHTYQDGGEACLWTLSWNGRTIMRHLDGGEFVITGTTFHKRVRSFLNEDFRFYVSPLALFRAAFCQIGYEFKSPFLESEYGRRIWMYLLAEDFYTQLNTTDPEYRGNLLRFELNSTKTFEGHGGTGVGKFASTIFFDSLVRDLSGGTILKQNAWKYTAPFSGLYKLKFEATFVNDDSFYGTGSAETFVSICLADAKDPFLDREVEVGDVIFDDTLGYCYVRGKYTSGDINVANGNTTTLLPYADYKPVNIYDRYEVVHLTEWETENLLEFEWDTQIRPSSDVLVMFSPTYTYPVLHEGAAYLKAGVKLVGEPTGHHFYTGDKVKYSACLRKDPILDVLKGLMDIAQCHIDEDAVNKVITLYQSDDVLLPSINGDTFVEGFYRDYQYSDVRNDLVADSIIMSTNQSERYIKLGFKDVKAENLPSDQEENALTKIIDRGADLGTETKELRNPYFSGTMDIIAPNTISPFQDGLRLPCLSTDVDTYTTDVTPRILYAQWYGAQTRRSLPFYYANNDYSDTALFTWGDNPINLIIPDALFAYLSNDPIALSSPVGRRGIPFTYGDRPMDFYERFWMRTIKDSYPYSEVQAIVLWDRVKALSANFRDKVMIPNKGTSAIYKLIAIRDIDTDRDLPVLLDLRRGDSVFNPVPCDCNVKTCYSYNPVDAFHPWSELDKVSLTFFEVEGTQYVIDPIYLSTKNVVVVNGETITDNIVTAFNNLNLQGFTFEAEPTTETTPVSNFNIKISYPACARFTIVFRSDNQDQIFWMITEEGFYYYDPIKQNWITEPYSVDVEQGFLSHAGCVSSRINCEVC